MTEQEAQEAVQASSAEATRLLDGITVAIKDAQGLPLMMALASAVALCLEPGFDTREEAESALRTTFSDMVMSAFDHAREAKLADNEAEAGQVVNG